MQASIFTKFIGAATVAVVLGFTINVLAQSSGWPSDALLTSYGISGMSAPQGATDITHEVLDFGEYGGEYGDPLVITFKHSNATAASGTLRDWLVRNGWAHKNIFGEEVYTKNVRFARGSSPMFVRFIINEGMVVLNVSDNAPRS